MVSQEDSIVGFEKTLLVPQIPVGPENFGLHGPPSIPFGQAKVKRHPSPKMNIYLKRKYKNIDDILYKYAGCNGGEYYTPSPLIGAMIEVMRPQIGERIFL